MCLPSQETEGVYGYRPLNRILVAQRITQPQAWIQGLVTLFHLAINYLLVNVFKGPYYMTAWAYTISTVFTCLLFTSYFAISGKSYCSWGTGVSLQAFRVSFAYSSFWQSFVACFQASCKL